MMKKFNQPEKTRIRTVGIWIIYAIIAYFGFFAYEPSTLFANIAYWVIGISSVILIVITAIALWFFKSPHIKAEQSRNAVLSFQFEKTDHPIIQKVSYGVMSFIIVLLFMTNSFYLLTLYLAATVLTLYFRFEIEKAYKEIDAILESNDPELEPLKREIIIQMGKISMERYS